MSGIHIKLLWNIQGRLSRDFSFSVHKMKTFQNDFVMPFKILKICYGLIFDRTELKTVFKDPVL